MLNRLARVGFAGSAALALLLSGCSPNRAEESQQIAEQIKGMPGVEGTSYNQHSNPIVAFKEPSFYLKVRPRPDVTGAQLTEVWKTFTRKVFDTGYRHYHVVLDVGACPEMPFVHGPYAQPCNGFSAEVDPGNPTPPTPSYQDWLAMITGKYATAVNGTSTSAGSDLRQRFLLSVRKRTDTDSADGLPKDFRPQDITAVYRRVLKDFPNQQDSSWTVTATDSYESPGLSTSNGPPDDEVLVLWERLATITVPTKAEFVMKPKSSDFSAVRVTFSATPDPRARAVAQLALLREYGQPVQFDGTVPGEGTVHIRINGCSDGSASGWEGELRQQFENCSR
ncbi:hypothetical protein FZI91_22225 [Mycobacterium sp. CBMA271]|uniref:hypothetical protein n=1 Tax=unclassified Mycobacteroides TaxID=2618759 RepID=UPI0012DFB1B5|nr:MULTISPECIES: hypothetical protein [unclassified Mycobacteroides]MUM15791.1 hypothetical protein [Mycobacteroides sp. CBMA 326]MUM24399.1 hypothetical protein [Mycobacteroides sp. CBMA 271]